MMLAPGNNETLLELLRPPVGYELDQAVGTTFSLNLDALLIAPAAFALFEATAASERSVQDLEPLGLLDSLRRHAKRITIFCQAGQIAPPPSHRRLLAYLESAVVPVAAPRGGVFHPKVWVLRYRETEGQASSYRLLVLSRNLTYDRSWDTALRLDSADDSSAASLPGLADFLAALPSLAVGELDQDRRTSVASLGEDVRSIGWQLPDGYDAAEFLPLGFGDEVSPPPLPADPDRLLVVSPFVGAAFLQSLPRTDRTLVALPSWLLKAGARGVRGFGTYVLDDTADVEASGDEPVDGRLADPRIQLSGLHAKLYVAEADGRTTVLTGSANATGAGWDQNVEAVVRLEGRTDGVGTITSMLDDRADPIAFGRLLLPFDVSDEPGDEFEDPMAGAELDALRRELASATWVADVVPEDDGMRIDLRVSGAAVPMPNDVIVTVWPISIPVAERPLDHEDEGFAATFETSLEGLTAFFVLRLQRGDMETQGVLKAHLIGFPENREQRLLALLIGDAERFLRYLLLLLADASDRIDISELAEKLTGEMGGQDRRVVDDLPLLEAMLSAVTRHPAKLEHIGRLLDDLREATDSELAPPEFAELWQSVWSAVEEEAR